ncbi:hypothetical protein, partial [Haloquadratum walsbyi]|uniref:hypothetical protein n=1 Tax=Haloquadratum walsbyi TaxID=293091 RepID=UPI0026EC4229
MTYISSTGTTDQRESINTQSRRDLGFSSIPYEPSSVPSPLVTRSGVDVIVSKTRKTYLTGVFAARSLNVPHVVHIGSS